jgi:hypothetical protein
MLRRLLKTEINKRCNTKVFRQNDNIYEIYPNIDAQNGEVIELYYRSLKLDSIYHISTILNEINLLIRKFSKNKNTGDMTYQFKHESFIRVFVVLELISSGDSGRHA